MVLYDEDEIKQQQRRVAGATLIALLLIVVVLMGSLAYDFLKPLPQTKGCERLGYEAGKITDGLELCYKECKSNELSSCAYRSVPI